MFDRLGLSRKCYIRARPVWLSQYSFVAGQWYRGVQCCGEVPGSVVVKYRVVLW